MFYGKRIEKIEEEMRMLRRANDDLASAVLAGKQLSFDTGITRRVYSRYTHHGYDVPVIKEIPVTDVINALMQKVGLELVYTEGTDEMVSIQPKPQTELKSATKRKQMNKTKA